MANQETPGCLETLTRVGAYLTFFGVLCKICSNQEPLVCGAFILPAVLFAISSSLEAQRLRTN